MTLGFLNICIPTEQPLQWSETLVNQTLTLQPEQWFQVSEEKDGIDHNMNKLRI